MRRRFPRTALLFGALLCFTLALASIFFGAESLPVKEAWAEWQRGAPLADSPVLSVLVYQRLPRTLAALIAGAGLALAGCVFQALLRNPLATPYTLGIASASALGAWLAFVLMDMGWFIGGILGLPAVQAFAFLFAGVDVLLVYLLAARRTRTSPAVLLLAGVTLGMVSNSGILLTRYLARPDRIVMMDHWLMGGVDVLGFDPIYTLVIGATPCIILLWTQAGKFDQIGFSTELAAGRGINVRRLQLVTFLVGSLLTAVIVSEVGPIGFVGLIVPHAVRTVTGPKHGVLIPACLLVGGAFLCACDLVARQILPGETPIGIITTLIGGPFFLFLLLRRRFTDWEE